MLLGPLKKSLRYAAIRGGLEASALGAHVVPVGGRGVVFTLHHVRPYEHEAFDPNAILSITPEFLDQAIQVALTAGLTPVHLHDLPVLLASSDEKRNFVAFTLDDGYKNNLQFAAPVFRKHAVPFTVFVTPGFVERTRSMWWETIAAICRKGGSLKFDFGSGAETIQLSSDLQKAAAFERLTQFVKTVDEDDAVEAIDQAAMGMGVDPISIVAELVMTEDEFRKAAGDPLLHFGAHTLTHVNLKRVGDERLCREIDGSKGWIGERAGYEPLSFSYPYGWTTAVGNREAEAAIRAGFRAAVTTQPGVLSAECAAAPTTISRVSLNGYYQRPRYVRALISGLPFKLM